MVEKILARCGKIAQTSVVDTNRQGSSMDFDQIIAAVTSFYHDYQLISIIALIALVIFLYQDPKKTLKYLVFVIALLIAGFFILQLEKSSDPATSGKRELVQKTKRALGE